MDASISDAVTVRRVKTIVLQDVSATIRRGSITGILGPSGCGKSTLMRAIVGTQVIHSGSVIVLGQSTGSRDLRGRVGYVTQSPTVYLDLV